MAPLSEVGLALLAIINKYSDENHKLSLDQICRIMFEDYGFTVDVKKLANYVKLIHKYGFEIDAYRYLKKEIYVKNVSFLAEEAYLICVSLLNNDHLSDTQKGALVKKIFGKLNVYQQNEFIQSFDNNTDRQLVESFLSADRTIPKNDSYIGMKRKMRDGKIATIVGYRSEDDIDVKIGTVTLFHKHLFLFESGQLSILSQSQFASQRLGKVNVMASGEKATIIGYTTNRDITVQFEDGTVVDHKAFRSFMEGKIRNPNSQSFKQMYLGFQKTMRNGQLATIIDYRTSEDIDVLFEDGTIVRHRTIHNFKRGQVRNPNINRYQKRAVGLRKKMRNGDDAEIIEYRNVNDITVKFQDGTIIHKRKYNDFLDGKIIPHKKLIDYRSERLNETRLMRNGQLATIISYNSTTDIDVKFEDGTIVKKRGYKAFLNGYIKNPNIVTRDYRSERLNETKLMRNGQMATIISYKSAINIDVKFEDGTTVKKRCYKSFQKGTIQNPNKTITKYQLERINETRLMRNGQRATIILYNSAISIDVKFEDGTIVQNKTYYAFQKGSIQNPNKEDS